MPRTVDELISRPASIDRARHVAEFETSRAEQARLDAEAWKDQNGMTSGSLGNVRGLAELRGMEKWLLFKLAGEPSSGRGQVGSRKIRFYREQLRKVQAEMRRRVALGKETVSLANPSTEPRHASKTVSRARGKSPGRPRDASRHVPLSRRGPIAKKAES
jgi:hypothetical protein